MPRKSGPPADSTTLQAGQGDNITMTDRAEISQAHIQGPESPSRPKAQTPSSKTNGEKASRKSVGNQDAEEGNATKPAKTAKSKTDETTIDDLLLPRSLISRLARGSLPPNTSLQKDALLALTKSATVFISYLAHTSNSMTSRKTIQAGDVLEAIRDMELQGVIGSRLEEEIKLFDDGVKGKRKGYRDRVKARESIKTDAENDDTQIDEEQDRGPQNKRIRRMSDEEDPSAQLIAEATRADAAIQRGGEANGHEESDGDNNAGEGEDEEAEEEEDDDDDDDNDDDEQDEDGENEENEERVAEDLLGVDEEERDRRKKSELLAPNGRMEVASEDESD